MPRVCVRQGCGLAIKNMKSYFCGPECKKQDKAEKMRLKRSKPKRGRRRVWITVRGRSVGVLEVKTAFELGRIAMSYPLPDLRKARLVNKEVEKKKSSPRSRPSRAASS